MIEVTVQDCETAVGFPGKFGSLPRYVPYFYEGMRMGFGVDVDGKRSFVIDDDDVAMFPELADILCVKIWVDPQYPGVIRYATMPK